MKLHAPSFREHTLPSALAAPRARNTLSKWTRLSADRMLGASSWQSDATALLAQLDTASDKERAEWLRHARACLDFFLDEEGNAKPILVALAMRIGWSRWGAASRSALNAFLASAGLAVVDPLLATVAAAPRVELVEEAARLLATLVDNSGVAPLLADRAVLKDFISGQPSPLWKRVVAIEALGRARAEATAEQRRLVLETALGDEEAPVREASAIGLGRIGRRASTEILLRRLQVETDEAVRESIQDALDEIAAA